MDIFAALQKQSVLSYSGACAAQLEIPYGAMFPGVTNTDGAPCTRNGFPGSTNDEIIPEWRFQGEVLPEDGAELHSVINGDDKIVAIYSDKHFYSR